APRLISLHRARAASEDTSASGGDELIEDLKAKWDAVEDKPTVLLYGGGAVVALWLTSVVVGAINAVPLVCPCVPVCVCPSEKHWPGRTTQLWCLTFADLCGLCGVVFLRSSPRSWSSLASATPAGSSTATSSSSKAGKSWSTTLRPSRKRLLERRN
ncbi:hypothetical protein ACJX0J_005455, partial [Zea mays]